MRVTLVRSGNDIEQDYDSLRSTLSRCATRVTNFDAAAYEPAAVDTLKRLWRVRMVSEHESSALFLRLGLQLYEANAHIDAQAVMTRMAFDELRHGEICGEVLTELGVDASCEVPAEVPQIALHAHVSREERALRNVIYHCAMTEIVNTARFVDTLDHTTDPFFRDVLRQLLADEVQHGSFGFQYLEAWAPWLAERPEVCASIERYLRHAFAFFERAMNGLDVAGRMLSDDERALGIPDPARLAPTLYGTIEGAIVPGLERFGIGAAKAYRERALEG